MNKSRKFAALIFIAVILIAFSRIAHAQDEEESYIEDRGMYLSQRKVFEGGVVAGANFAQVVGDYFGGFRQVGVNAGLIEYMHFSRRVALSMEMLYSQKGGKSGAAQVSPVSSSINVLNYSIRLNYVEVPLMINYFDKNKSHIGVGISYSRLINSKEVCDADTSGKYVSFDFNQEYPFRKDGLDFLAGADLHLWHGFFLNIRYQYGIIPVRTELPPPAYARTTQYNNIWAVRVMYLLK